MSTAKSRKAKTTKNPETTNSETATPTETPQDAGAQATEKASKSDKRRIVSVGFPEKTARQLKLLASVSGESIASIVVGSVTRTINKRLPLALAEMSADVEG